MAGLLDDLVDTLTGHPVVSGEGNQGLPGVPAPEDF
jgi:hypothetical protein